MKRILYFVLIAMSVPFMTSCGYNKMVSLEEGVTSQWAQVENVYQRRADLIPNLVNTVKGYAAHEKDVLESVTKARAEATSMKIDPTNMKAEDLQKFQNAQNGLSSALGRLLVVTEKYPDLKANENFMALQAQLESTENRITIERQKFNDATMAYNAYIRKFPQIMFAKMFGFTSKEYFKAQSGSEKAPEVKF